MEEPDQSQCIKENDALIEYNNHKKAKDNINLVTSTIHKEVAKGWVLILPLKTLLHIPHAMICPVGVASQTSYKLDGGRFR
jgi:hypothetical protein